ncbi:tetratricopeptide repeat protein [Amycolatopsis sp., V23-08]|uniref:Tetratricopeptide repeat protein n=1 Tax=Amycolatopsis heterodermiae TaxID=3110235 RepID=A0ABU5RJM6_9PSEU|nr:tetratricopeptide repeat protein [Amycolatopsis sp., V23-08]MEA5366020.1 tetratricopeptide repeat protein [Amycolatopsis sp., V23-08]
MDVQRLRGEITWLHAKLDRKRKRDSIEALELRQDIGERLLELRDPATEAWLREMVADQGRVFGPRNVIALTSWYGIASRCEEAGRVDEALALYAWLQGAYAYVLGQEHPMVHHCRVAAASTLHRAGRYAAAIDAYRAVVEPPVDVLLWIASAQAELGRFDEAEQTLREAGPALHDDVQAIRQEIQALLGAPGPWITALREQPQDPDDPVKVRAELAYALFLNGEFAEAASLAESVLQERLVFPGPEDRLTWESRLLLSRVLTETDRLADADHYARAVLAAGPFPPGHPVLLRA